MQDDVNNTDAQQPEDIAPPEAAPAAAQPSAASTSLTPSHQARLASIPTTAAGIAAQRLLKQSPSFNDEVESFVVPLMATDEGFAQRVTARSAEETIDGTKLDDMVHAADQIKALAKKANPHGLVSLAKTSRIRKSIGVVARRYPWGRVSVAAE